MAPTIDTLLLLALIAVASFGLALGFVWLAQTFQEPDSEHDDRNA